MKQLSIYALAFAVILGSAITVSECARAFLLSGQTQTAPAVGDEEFVGPFASWTNVQTSCGATGNGSTDDTSAIQTCINNLSSTNPVLWFPAGTYKISSTLVIGASTCTTRPVDKGKQYISLIGADPSTTSILWAGPSNGVMVCINGAGFMRVNRVTFNGASLAATAVNDQYVGSGNYTSTGDEYADDVFENTTGAAFVCGGGGYQCSEIALLRDTFSNNNVGYQSYNANALDQWIWWSVFQNNSSYSVTNLPPYGDDGGFSVYGSYFSNPSANGDIAFGNTAGAPRTIRGNYSTGSSIFLSAGGTGAVDPTVAQDNIILNTAYAISLWQRDPGQLVLLDNVIETSPTSVPIDLGGGFSATAANGPAAAAGNNSSSAPLGNLFSMGNTFTVGSGTCSISGPISSAWAPADCHQIDDQVVSAASLNPPAPTLPGVLPNNGRTIYDVTAGSLSSLTTQIAAAGARCGTRPVVHVPAGTYNVTATIVVPECDMQIIGDGGYTNFACSSGITPMIQLQGPSKVVLRDFQVSANCSGVDGIEVDNADQAGSQIFIEEPFLANSSTNLLVDSLDYTSVEVHDSIEVGASTYGVNVIGGTSAATGNWLGGTTNIFCDLGYGDSVYWNVSSGGRLNVQQVFVDGGGGGTPHYYVSLSDTSPYDVFSLSAASLWLAPSGTLLGGISYRGYEGTSALVDVFMPNAQSDANVSITGSSSSAKILALGPTFYPSSSGFTNTSSPATTTELLNGFTFDFTTVTGITEQGCCSTPFLTATLNQIRSNNPTFYHNTPSGVTGAFLSRVYVTYARYGIHLKH